MMIAALYIEKDGVYCGIDGVDPWDIDRDARDILIAMARSVK